jgi:hypothetical protein
MRDLKLAGIGRYVAPWDQSGATPDIGLMFNGDDELWRHDGKISLL